MARPREFDPDQALEGAMNVFWEHGYDAASLPFLLDGMGLSRGSFYKAYADKKSLFIKVLNRYETETLTPIIALLATQGRDGLERINDLFERITSAVADGDRRGCLLCSAAAGPAAVDGDISELVHIQLRRIEDAFLVALTQSVQFEQCDREDRVQMASLLLTQYMGLRMLVRSNGALDTITHATTAVREVLRRQPPGCQKPRAAQAGA